MTGKDVLIRHKTGKIPAYFSEPESGESIGVIVISAIFGVDDDTKIICDRLAESGYPSLALNMFWQDEVDTGPLSGSDHERAKARSVRVNRKDGNSYIESAISDLKSYKSCNGKVVIFGFCCREGGSK